MADLLVASGSERLEGRGGLLPTGEVQCRGPCLLPGTSFVPLPHPPLDNLKVSDGIVQFGKVVGRKVLPWQVLALSCSCPHSTRNLLPYILPLARFSHEPSNFLSFPILFFPSKLSAVYSFPLLLSTLPALLSYRPFLHLRVSIPPDAARLVCSNFHPSRWSWRSRQAAERRSCE